MNSSQAIRAIKVSSTKFIISELIYRESIRDIPRASISWDLRQQVLVMEEAEEGLIATPDLGGITIMDLGGVMTIAIPPQKKIKNWSKIPDTQTEGYANSNLHKGPGTHNHRDTINL